MEFEREIDIKGWSVKKVIVGRTKGWDRDGEREFHEYRREEADLDGMEFFCAVSTFLNEGQIYQKEENLVVVQAEAIARGKTHFGEGSGKGKMEPR